jgi:hypothetical protein
VQIRSFPMKCVWIVFEWIWERDHRIFDG